MTKKTPTTVAVTVTFFATGLFGFPPQIAAQAATVDSRVATKINTQAATHEEVVAEYVDVDTGAVLLQASALSQAQVARYATVAAPPQYGAYELVSARNQQIDWAHLVPAKFYYRRTNAPGATISVQLIDQNGRVIAPSITLMTYTLGTRLNIVAPAAPGGYQLRDVASKQVTVAANGVVRFVYVATASKRSASGSAAATVRGGSSPAAPSQRAGQVVPPAASQGVVAQAGEASPASLPSTATSEPATQAAPSRAPQPNGQGSTAASGADRGVEAAVTVGDLLLDANITALQPYWAQAQPVAELAPLAIQRFNWANLVVATFYDRRKAAHGAIVTVRSSDQNGLLLATPTTLPKRALVAGLKVAPPAVPAGYQLPDGPGHPLTVEVNQEVRVAAGAATQDDQTFGSIAASEVKASAAVSASAGAFATSAASRDSEGQSPSGVPSVASMTSEGQAIASGTPSNAASLASEEQAAAHEAPSNTASTEDGSSTSGDANPAVSTTIDGQEPKEQVALVKTADDADHAVAVAGGTVMLALVGLLAFAPHRRQD